MADRRARFEVYENTAGDYAWRFKASNGRTVASGEGYRKHADCMRAIEIIRTQAADADLNDATAPEPEPLNGPTPKVKVSTLYVVVEVKDQIRRGVASHESRAQAEKDARSRPEAPGVHYEVEEGTETVTH